MHKALLAFLALAMSALAADFNGNWSGEGVASGETHSLYFMIKQDGNTISGTGGPDAGEQHPFQSAKVEGDKIIFDIAVNNKGTLHFELKPEGQGLKGIVEVRHPDSTESGTVTLKKT